MSKNILTTNESLFIIDDMVLKDLKYEEAVTAHSFQAGVTSTMARLGYSEKLQGCWNSDAFLRYTKLGRTNRLRDQVKLFTSWARDAERNNINL